MIGIMVVLALSTLAVAGGTAADKKQDSAKKPSPERPGQDQADTVRSGQSSGGTSACRSRCLPTP